MVPSGMELIAGERNRTSEAMSFDVNAVKFLLRKSCSQGKLSSTSTTARTSTSRWMWS
jgi:hypothetical protein